MILKNNKRKGILYILIMAISVLAIVKNISDILIVIPFILLGGVFGYRLISLGTEGK